MPTRKTPKSSKEIQGPEDRADRHGQSLTTMNHEVIKKWAEDRGAKPAAVAGAEHEDLARVLRLSFPDFKGQDLKELSWEDWFEIFDENNLVFIYQEKLKDGSQSNFFRIDNPDTEEA